MTGAESAPSPHARLLAALSYLGGLLSGIVVLGLEQHDGFVRFHAMQSVVTFSAVVLAHLALRGLGLVGLVASVPFVAGVALVWLYLIVQAWRGRRQHLPYVGAFADHLLK